MAKRKLPEKKPQRARAKIGENLRCFMQDDKRWLRHPILPRPPALPVFGPDLRALIGLDPSELEKDVPATLPAASIEAETSPSDTEPHALGADSGVHAVVRVIRTGT